MKNSRSFFSKDRKQHVARQVNCQKVHNQHWRDEEAQNGEYETYKRAMYKIIFSFENFLLNTLPLQVGDHTFARCTKIIGTCLVIIVEDFVNKLRDTLAVLLQGIERILDRLINSFLNVLAHIFNLICTSNQLKARKNSYNSYKS